MDAGESQRRPWSDHLIGSFALVHVAAILIVGLGPSVDLAEPFAGFSDTWNTFQRQVDRGVVLYGSLLGPRQHWSMFGAVGEASPAVHLEVRTPDGVRPVYIERSNDAAWNRLAFDHYRWREMMGVWGRERPPGKSWDRFVAWVGPQVAELDDEACEVNVVVRVAPSLRPEALRAGERHGFGEVRREAVYRVPGRPCSP